MVVALLHRLGHQVVCTDAGFHPSPHQACSKMDAPVVYTSRPRFKNKLASILTNIRFSLRIWVFKNLIPCGYASYVPIARVTHYWGCFSAVVKRSSSLESRIEGGIAAVLPYGHVRANSCSAHFICRGD